MTLNELDAEDTDTRMRAPAIIRPRRSVENADRPTGWRPLRIAMVGQKGMPATYGGIERHVEELSARLVALGHEVTVYCRDSYDAMPMDQYLGVRLKRTPTLPTKHFDAIAHAATATLAALKDKPDVLHYHGIGPGLVAPLPRYLSRVRVVQTIHGLDNQRAKWGRLAKAVLGAAHWCSGRVPDVRIAVSRTLAGHYRDRFGTDTRYVPNGVGAQRSVPAQQITTRFGLTEGGYLLLVGRLVPEKAADLLIRAFRRLPSRPGEASLKLAIVGGSSFSDEYVKVLRAAAGDDPRIVFTGFAYGDLLAELYTNAAGFVQPSRLEGLPLTLLEACAYGLPVVASDIPPHVELLGADAAGHRIFRDGDEDDLVAALSRMLAEPRAERLGAHLHGGRLRAEYSWDTAAREIERVYLSLVTRS
ncbi:glycosyltransferase family 4 protein [Actinoplanes sp. NBRC 103695]|uniref:glycosyltransferase family 4 protein n=1 Tax=Actinoplanes sp. NBRC 103695 TaxID=3032202 RepID=UPI0024A07483|nr:glycosyltransferase family 4 protein [Actinoplanes sp. NBRC 103695]GLY99117.1 glycosyl transferase [Actinoplanes sp. NBRC 103695]